MNYRFKTLWNAMFLVVGPVWAVLARMIWVSGQLRNPHHESLFLGVVIPGFILIYLSGFIIEKRHVNKLKGRVS